MENEELEFEDLPEDEIENEELNEENEDLPEDDGEELAEDESSEDEQKQKPDKVTSALIKQKQQNKQLRDRLKELEDRELERQAEKTRNSLAAQYIQKGYDEEEAIKMANDSSKVEKLERELRNMKYERQAEKLEIKYPEIQDNLKDLIAVCEKTGWSLEKVCVAEYGSRERDSRIKREQLQTKKKSAELPKHSSSDVKSFKLDPDDESAYQYYAKRNPGTSRRQYAEKIKSNQNIPHDRWD